MNKKNAMKWVKALRSGKYKQGRESLVGENKGECQYCCLGVLAKINGFSEDDMGGHALLTHDLVQTCEIRSESGDAFDEDGDNIPEGIRLRVGRTNNSFDNLAGANDGGASFKAIATWIEKNYEKL